MSWGDIPEWAYSASQSLLQTLKLVDPLTYHHCCRVGEYARRLARDAGLNEYEQKIAEFAGLLHDIGKMGISQDIIGKPSRLSDSEFEIMKSHPELSELIIQPLASSHEFFREVMPGVRGHHERIDGRGYPDKKRGDEISILARIILIVDTYDAMSQTRAYRKGLSDEIIYEELQTYAGTQFDSQLVQVFLQAHPKWLTQHRDAQTQDKIIKLIA